MGHQIINDILKINTMKSKLYKTRALYQLSFVVFAMFLSVIAFAQNDTSAKETDVPKKAKPVKNTFESVWIIDNQTVMVPVKKTFEMDIMHRFGTVGKGYEDFWGFFAPSNIRLGVSYSPIDKLNVGIGITKSNMLWDFSAKYSIIEQTKNMYPVSVTYYGNASFDTRKDGELGAFKKLFSKEKLTGGEGLFTYSTDRFSYFHQLIIARKITDKLSLQIAPSLSHQNSVTGYYKEYDSVSKTKPIGKEMENSHFAIAFSGRYRLTDVTSILLNIDQPITKHTTNNPNPNISIGLEFGTGSHAFQLFLGNYFYLNPQRNNLFNKNNYKNAKGDVSLKQFLIGFNVTRLWNY